MATLEVSCNNQSLKWVKDPEKICAGNINIDGITFSFCPLWDGFTKTAVFYKAGGEAYHKPLIESNTCLLPPEVTDTNGLVYVGVFGNKGECRRTTEAISFYLNEGIITEGKPSEPTPDIYAQIITLCNEAVNTANSVKEDANNGANRAQEAADNAEASEKAAAQAFKDLLAMINSGDIVLAVNGKLPLSSIPATATHETYEVESEDELTSLVAQRGDLAELVEVVLGERTITKTWQCLGDASVRANWVVWGTSYAVQSGNATTADNAVNANMINNHRLVEMTEEDFQSAVKDADTYYLVY